MKRIPRLLIPGAVALLFGCDATTPVTPPSAGVAIEANLRARSRVTVVGQNIYVGADVDRIFAALVSPDPKDDLTTLLEEIQVLQNTDFPTRAAAFAAEVERTRPHFFGLMEVTTFDIDLSALGGPTYSMAFLPVLEAAFQARGLPYEVVARQHNFDVSPLPGISYVDEDVVFRDTTRTEILGPVIANTYQYNLGTVFPGVTLERGYIVVPASIEGQAVVFASTHLEDDVGGLDLRDLRAAQMYELLQVIGSAPLAIIVGDLNDFAGTPMHELALDAGFRDVWAEMRPGTKGYTCCHESDLSNPVPVGKMDQRIDFVLARGFHRDGGNLIGSITRIGFGPEDKVPGPVYPLWPADHAGLAATLHVTE